MKNVSVSIVIPNWNGARLLREHLPKVIETSEGAEIIVADDASTDESVDLLTSEFPSVTLVRSARRRGFSSNVNAGVARAKGDIVVLLNTDIVPKKGYLKPLLKHFSDEHVFAVGCKDLSHEKGKIVERGRGKARWYRGFYIHRADTIAAGDTAWVSGGSGAFRRSIWRKLGGMDVKFDPFYWEDIELSYRARHHGFTLVFEPKSVVDHYHEKGKIRMTVSTATIKRIAFRNQFLFIWKHIAHPRSFIEHMIWTNIRLLKAVLSSNYPYIFGYISALIRSPYLLAYRLSSKPYPVVQSDF